jgi:RNA polymerase sigma-70 factor (ECF subfamily)
MADRAVFDSTAGGAAEIQALMERFNRRLYRVAWSILQDEGAAEDAVQEGYLQFFRHRRTFRGDSDIGTWLTRIVINQALMQRRRGRPAVELDPVQPSAEILRHPALVSTEDPERLAARRELRVLIEAAIAKLAEPFRVVFVLREVEALSTEDVALLLKIGPETVRSRLHRAKAALRKHLDAEIAANLSDSFPFAGARCAGLTARVLARLSSAGLMPQP